MHDCLYHLRGALDEGSRPRIDGLLRELAAFAGGRHPLREQLRALVEGFAEAGLAPPPAPPPTLEGVLIERGVLAPGEDPVRGVERYLVRQEDVRRTLEARLGYAEARHAAATRAANLLATAAVSLAMIAALSIGIATGLLPINWLESPELETESPQPAPAERERPR